MKMTREEKNWILYDVGNSAFVLLVSTILPIYFNYLAQGAGLTDAQYLAYWGYAASIATIIYLFIAVFAIFLHTQLQFWILAVLVGMFQGGVQALSRSYFAKIIPAEQAGEYFGLMDICGKRSGVSRNDGCGRCDTAHRQHEQRRGDDFAVVHVRNSVF